ncbi:hypothetical protein CR513_58710, partial [Mucuna pruriens]
MKQSLARISSQIGSCQKKYHMITTPGSQPTLKSVLSSNEAIYKAKIIIAQWFYDACISLMKYSHHMALVSKVIEQIGLKVDVQLWLMDDLIKGKKL